MPKTLRGAVLACENGRVVGWAFDPENAGEPVELEVCLDDDVVVRTHANMHALPLAEKGIGSGNHAFSIKLPDEFVNNEIKTALRVRSKDGSIILPYIPDWDISLKSPPLVALEQRAESNVAYLPVANTNRELLPGAAIEELSDPVTREEEAAPAEARKTMPLPQEEVLEEMPAAAAAAAPEVKVIAFYLPQFHPTPENDEWWGKGFTEWTNVSQAMPYFEGHYQPHMPADLGFYDLRVPEVREQQAELARSYGIHGFCYYYYWFSGKRILERPLQDMLTSGRPDYPFCLCWANENWSRRWDGSEDDVLIKQEYKEEDAAQFARDMLLYFRDSRYIRVNSKPLLIVYRPSVIPDVQKVTDTWREIWRQETGEEVYLCAAHTFGDKDPIRYGFDAGVEFPPHNTPVGDITSHIADKTFKGRIYDYNELVTHSLLRGLPSYKLFRTVFPSWDNTPRKGRSGHAFINSSPQAYGMWLRGVIEQTAQRYEGDERMVFVNAWNEWGEGAHLEPDRKYGHQFLQATTQAQNRIPHVDTTLDTLGKAIAEKIPEYAFLINDLKDIIATRERTIRVLSILTRDKVMPEEYYTIKNLKKGLPPLPDGFTKRDNLFCNIERIQHASADSSPIIVDRKSTLFTVGWAFHPEIEKPMLYLVFENETTGAVYHCPVSSRIHRNDIPQAFPNINEVYTIHAGFEIRINISEMDEGEYKVGVLLKGPRNYAGAWAKSKFYVES